MQIIIAEHSNFISFISSLGQLPVQCYSVTMTLIHLALVPVSLAKLYSFCFCVGMIYLPQICLMRD